MTRKDYMVMAGFDGKFERLARSFSSAKEAKKALNKAFTLKTDNVWVDSFGQEFTIVEVPFEVPAL